MEPLTASIKFKFRFINARGQPSGLLSKRGWFNGTTLTLGDKQLRTDEIVRAITRLGRLALIVSQPDGSVSTISMVVYGSKLKKLLPALVKGISAAQAEKHRQHLAKIGKADQFHVETCPYCSATIDISRHDPSPQAYCPYCDTIVTLEGERPSDEAKYHLCDACGLYSQPRGFTILYFAFLIYVIAWRQRRVHRCDACMRPEAWKMLFGNLLFVLAVPVAITQLCRVYFGGSRFSKAFTGLDKANALTKRGKHDLAVAEYQKIEERLLCCAGVRFNHGLALSRAGRHDDAIASFREALEDCSNYLPALEALGACLSALGRTGELDAFRERWQVTDEAQPAGLLVFVTRCAPAHSQRFDSRIT